MESKVRVCMTFALNIWILGPSVPFELTNSDLTYTNRSLIW